MSTSPFTVPPSESPLPASSQEDRTAAILAYLTPIGFVVAVVLHSNKKTELGAFHLRQALGFLIIGFVLGVALFITAFILAFIPVLGPIMVFLLWSAAWIGGLVLLAMGLLAAIQGRQTPVPIIGEPIQKHLANTFN